MKLPSRIGAWQPVDLLGRGGMGLVYRAKHERTGEPAALKTVLVDDARLAEACQREIRTLMRLSHPGIVRIIGSGVHEGRPWYAMELLEGRTLAHTTTSVSGTGNRTWGDDAITLEIPTDEIERAAVTDPLALDHALALCGPLAAMHAEGIVHRDLKPENVLLRPDASLVIADFGLSATSIGRDAIDDERTAGTAAYMSPEQVRGDPVDARSDLYALGCLLYELLTGRPPFVGPVGWVRTAHLTDLPVPPSTLVSGSWGHVDAVVLKLLAKRPRDRFASADDVALALLAAGARGDHVLASRRPLLRAELAGREDAIALARTMVADVSHGRGRTLLVGGASGGGKTRFARHVVGEATRAGVSVFVGECSGDVPVQHRLGGLFAPMTTLVAKVRRRGDDELERVLAPHARVLAEVLPSARDLAPGPAAPLPTAAEAQRLNRTLIECFEAVGPTILVIEGLHQADPTTVSFLQSLAMGESRIAVVGTFRNDADTTPLARLTRTPGIDRIDLPPLADGELASIATEMLGLDEPDSRVRALARACRGNPLVLGEALHAASEGREDPLAEWEGAVPAAVGLAVFLERRIDRLDAIVRRCLEAAAVVRDPIDPGRVARITGLDAERVTDALADLVRLRLLDEGAEGLRLAHEPLRHVVLDRVGDLPALHRAAAAAFDDDDGRAGDHLLRAGDADAAAARLIVAAGKALDRRALVEAEHLYRSVVSAFEDPHGHRLEAQYRLAADILRVTGRYDEAFAALEASLADALSLGDHGRVARAHMGRGMIERDRGEYATALASFDRALQLAEAAGRHDIVRLVWGHEGATAHAWGKYGEARRYWEKALELARAAGTRAEQATILSDLAMLADNDGRDDEARALYEQSIALHRELGTRLHEAIGLGNFAELELKVGRLDAAYDLAQQALLVKREQSYRRGEGYTLYTIGRIHLARGEHAAAARVLQQATEVFDGVLTDEWTMRAALYQAVCCARAGQWSTVAALIARLSPRNPENVDTVSAALWRLVHVDLALRERTGIGAALAAFREALPKVAAANENLPFLVGELARVEREAASSGT